MMIPKKKIVNPSNINNGETVCGTAGKMRKIDRKATMKAAKENP